MSSVELRPASASDAAGVERVAQLDSAGVPAGRLLVAELDGRIVAAYAIESGEAVADPFTRTAHLVTALRAQSRESAKGGREWRRRSSPQPAT